MTGRRLEGWKVRSVAKNRKRKGSRSQGFEESSGERQKTEYRSQKSEVRRQEAGEG
jgi:hypothetical protein